MHYVAPNEGQFSNEHRNPVGCCLIITPSIPSHCSGPASRFSLSDGNYPDKQWIYLTKYKMKMRSTDSGILCVVCVCVCVEYYAEWIHWIVKPNSLTCHKIPSGIHFFQTDVCVKGVQTQPFFSWHVSWI